MLGVIKKIFWGKGVGGGGEIYNFAEFLHNCRPI